MKVRGVRLVGKRAVDLETRELRVGPDDVLVKTHLAGICGTDKNFYEGIFPKGSGLDTETRKDLTYPFFFGHEGGGTVVEVGEKVRGYSAGDKVISFAWVDTFADHFTAKEADLERVPDGLEMDLACLGEPIGCAVFSGLESCVQLGDSVAVYGAGFAGQIVAQVAKRKGAHRVMVVDVVEEKLALARTLGADHAVNARTTDPVAAILELTGGAGADVVVEMAGSQETVNRCTASVRKNGTLVFYSWITQDVTLNLSRWHNDSLRILNTGLVHHSQEERRLWTPYALRPVIQGLVDVRPLITHEFPLSEVARAFETASGDPGAIKVVVRP
jgi:L-iditol 2-dehydrogenase